MKHRPSTLSGGRKFRYVDYLDFPDDGQRYEIIDGDVHVTAAPRPDHQRISRCIWFALMEWAGQHAPAEVFHAPIDLVLADDTIVQPDLLVVLDSATITSRGIEAAPALVVEILSPATQDRDRGLKRARYARAGVREYWVVDQDTRTIEVHHLSDAGDLDLVCTARPSDTIASIALEDFAFETSVAFKDLPDLG